MSKMICPECGEEIKEGQLVCDNCHYRLPQPAAPAKPTQSTPAPSAPGKPAKNTQGSSVAMPESIMSHGDVAVNNSHAEDNSVHTDNSVQNNVQTNTNVQHSVTDNSQTVNNTNQTVNNNTTILIMGGGNAPLPAGMDENTAAAVRQAQQQMTQQQPAHQPQRQQHAQPQQEQHAAQAQDGQKGIGSIAGGVAYAPPTVSSGSKNWIMIAVIAVIVLGGGWLLFSGDESSEPAQTTQVAEAPAAQPAPKQSSKSTAASKPAKKTATVQASENTAPSTAAVATAAPARAAAPARDAHYDAGMAHYQAGEGLEAVREFKASGSKASLLMLSKIYEEGCGTVEANAMMAMKYKKEANNK